MQRVTAISYHDTVKVLQDLDWSANSPFARPEWFRLLEESGMTPLIVTATQDGETLALPLHQRGERLESLSNWYAFTWADLRTKGFSGSGPLKDLARDLARRTSRVDLAKLPEEDGTNQRMVDAFRASGWIVLRAPGDTNHILRLNGRDYAQYLANRPGQLRTTLKRKAKKVDVSLSNRFSANDWAAYEEIYAQSWKPEEGDPALLQRFAEAESAAGRYRFGLAKHDGKPVAAQFWTVEAGTAYIHKLAHREDAQALSPGTTLTAALFAHVIDTDHVELVDFGTGDDPYKRDWMEDVRTRWHLTCLRPGTPRNWPVIAKAIARKLVSRPAAG